MEMDKLPLESDKVKEYIISQSITKFFIWNSEWCSPVLVTLQLIHLGTELRNKIKKYFFQFLRNSNLRNNHY
jgi:hypothetical protein